MVDAHIQLHSDDTAAALNSINFQPDVTMTLQNQIGDNYGGFTGRLQDCTWEIPRTARAARSYDHFIHLGHRLQGRQNDRPHQLEQHRDAGRVISGAIPKSQSDRASVDMALQR